MTSKLIRTHIPALCMTALLGLASCSQDEWPGGQESFDGGIVFTSPYHLTRSDAMRYGTFKGGDQVGVLGFCKADNNGRDISASPWDTKKPFCQPDVFYNQMLEYNAADNLWTYDWRGTGSVGGQHPWSENENNTYAFFAYYPYAEVTESRGTFSGLIPEESGSTYEHRGTIELSADDATGDPTITYRMPFANTDGSSADTERDWTRVPDLMLAYSIDHVKADGAVKLNFRHLFCAFEFRVNNYNTTPVNIRGLYVSGEGFYRSVSVTGQESGYTVPDDRSDLYSGRFNIISNRDGDEFTCPAGTEQKDDEGNVIEIVPATVPITVDENSDDPVDLLFIPDENGKLTANGYESPSVTLTVDGIQQNATMNLKEATFRPGVRSIFNINIVGNDIYLQVESDGTWEDGGDSDISFD